MRRQVKEAGKFQKGLALLENGRGIQDGRGMGMGGKVLISPSNFASVRANLCKLIPWRISILINLKLCISFPRLSLNPGAALPGWGRMASRAKGL